MVEIVDIFWPTNAHWLPGGQGLCPERKDKLSDSL
jgi:hypothetical protein